MKSSICPTVLLLLGLVQAAALADVRLASGPNRRAVAQTSVVVFNSPLRCRDPEPPDDSPPGFGVVEAACARSIDNPNQTCVVQSDARVEATLTGSQQDVRSITLRVQCGASTTSDPDRIVANDPNSPPACGFIGDSQGSADAGFIVDVSGRTRVRITFNHDLASDQDPGQAHVSATSSEPGSRLLAFAGEVQEDTLVRDMIIEDTDDIDAIFAFEVRVVAGVSSSLAFPDGMASASATVTVTFEPVAPAEIHWTSAASGDYADALNWDPHQVPQDVDTAIFDCCVGDGPVVIEANDERTGRWLIEGMAVDLSGPAVLTGLGGITETGLRITEGGRLTLDNELVAPNAAIEDGELRIGDESAILNVLSNLSVNATERLEVLVEAGGDLFAGTLFAGSTGTGTADITIRGASAAGLPSKLFVDPTVIGEAATTIGLISGGQLLVQSGASAELRGGLSVGVLGQGIVLLNGADAPGSLRTELLVTGETKVGVGADGVIQLENNARMVNTGNMQIGLGPGLPSGLVTLGGGGSLLNVVGTLSVGASGQGVMNILTANAAQCDTLIVGGESTQATGTVTLGELGAFLTIRGNAQIGIASGAGNLTVAGESGIILDGTMTIGGGTTAGNVALENATISGQGNIVVASNGSLLGTGTVSVPKTKVGTGSISPGLSPGTLIIDGDYEQEEGGTLIIEVAGLEPGQFDVLYVTGDATLAGQVDLRFIDGFVPSPGDTIDFVVVDGEITGILTGELVVPAGGGGGGAGGGVDGVGNANANDNMTEPNDNDVAENINDNAANANGNDNTGEVNDNADPIDEQPAEPTEDVEVRWEVTPESTCRVTIIEVTPRPTQDGDEVRPPAQSGGICGAGLGLVLPPLVVSFAFVRRRCNERDCAP